MSLQKFNEQQLSLLKEGKEIPSFQAGDTVCVNVKITEGATDRVQAYEGVCIARSGAESTHATFTIRKISHGEGVERTFQLYSPMIDSIKVVRRGVVRRAKLYYMRNLSGKAARIKEKVMPSVGKKDKAARKAAAETAAKA